MGTFLAALLVFAIAFVALALGTLIGREPIRGSCGGLRRFGLEGDCSCATPCARRRAELERRAARGPEDSP